MPEKISLDSARMMAYYSGRDGRDGAINARIGQADDDLKGHVGKDLTNKWLTSWGDSPEGVANAKRLDAVFKERDSLKARVKELETQLAAEYIPVGQLYIKKGK